ncbi:hypothetical protein L202_02643 [Cryptococcus amylolentus CBS 6039]|uniref:Uncharacterized protein n=2 Tax=Cryptococcus amylolentus TaxID=104669 RepID=A0A1E3HVP7_9TREE|nr:hypothetical protein L202_02643 [Cryptococcus amylolentus CBS 6039]ODN80392.1 hypothetical protein L202_02643 [Cryptococcus amylolentus CBS 6039]ODO09023.1 hypothetical protein I350_02620 [Cryptococcus amylolentus CBS 6273]
MDLPFLFPDKKEKKKVSRRGGNNTQNLKQYNPKYTDQPLKLPARKAPELNRDPATEVTPLPAKRAKTSKIDNSVRASSTSDSCDTHLYHKAPRMSAWEKQKRDAYDTVEALSAYISFAEDNFRTIPLISTTASSTSPAFASFSSKEEALRYIADQTAREEAEILEHGLLGVRPALADWDFEALTAIVQRETEVLEAESKQLGEKLARCAKRLTQSGTWSVDYLAEVYQVSSDKIKEMLSEGTDI